MKKMIPPRAARNARSQGGKPTGGTRAGNLLFSKVKEVSEATHYQVFRTLSSELSGWVKWWDAHGLVGGVLDGVADIVCCVLDCITDVFDSSFGLRLPFAPGEGENTGC